MLRKGSANQKCLENTDLKYTANVIVKYELNAKESLPEQNAHQNVGETDS